MSTFAFPATLRRESGSAYTVVFRDLPEAITSGTGRADALSQAADCLEEAVAGRISEALDIPPPSPLRRGEVIVALPATMAAKAALYLAIRDSGLPDTQVAARLGVDEKEIRRMIDPRHGTQLARIQKALAALGRKLVITVEAA